MTSRILMNINHASVAFDRYMRVGSVVRQSCNVGSYTVAYCLCSCACCVNLSLCALPLARMKDLQDVYISLSSNHFSSIRLGIFALGPIDSVQYASVLLSTRGTFGECDSWTDS